MWDVVKSRRLLALRGGELGEGLTEAEQAELAELIRELEEELSSGVMNPCSGP